VDNSSLMDVGEPKGCLEKYAFYLLLTQSVLLLLVKLKDVFGEILENKFCLAFSWILLKIQQFDYVWVLEIFEEIGLFDGNFMVSAHDLDGCGFSCFDITNEMDSAEVATSDFLQLLVFLHDRI